MHGDEVLRLEFEESANRVFGIHVDAAEAFGGIGPDGQQRGLRGEALPDFREYREIARVAGMIDGVLAVAKHIASEAAMCVVEDSRTPVPAGRHGDIHAAEAGRLPPVERADFRESEPAEQVFDAQRHDGDRSFAGQPAGVANDFAQRREVEVVHVRVCEEHGVNGGQVLDADAGFAQAMDQDEPVGENRVDQEVEATQLQQERGVANEGDAEFAGIHHLGFMLGADGRTK